MTQLRPVPKPDSSPTWADLPDGRTTWLIGVIGDIRIRSTLRGLVWCRAVLHTGPDTVALLVWPAVYPQFMQHAAQPGPVHVVGVVDKRDGEGCTGWLSVRAVAR